MLDAEAVDLLLPICCALILILMMSYLRRRTSECIWQYFVWGVENLLVASIARLHMSGNVLLALNIGGYKCPGGIKTMFVGAGKWVSNVYTC
jgi:hypothetical protein